MADKKKISISFDSDYNQENFYVKGNQDQITEIFENLLDNAITYSDSGTEIKISLSDKDKNIEFKITDQGHGIPKDDILRVSERFFRSKTANKYKKNSSGLGLSIVKHIVNRHAGDLSISSEEGVGSTFTVDLPKFSSDS
jgi:signal transduction histidine kinase